MVILKWLNSILVKNRPEVTKAAAGQGIDEKIKRNRKSKKSVDLANAALIDQAENLDDLINAGSSALERKKLKRKIKQKVASVIADEFDDPEIIEEVTEKITNAAEIDPYYKNLFSENSEK